MTVTASVPPEASTAHTNGLRIKSLYTAIQNADLTAIAACYDEHAYFEDIAFRCGDKGKIMEMWRYVCHGEPEVVEADVISADDRAGSGHWRVKYRFGKKPGLPVDNKIHSTFVFSNGLIIEHRDECDSMAWARQAFSSPIAAFLVGSVAPLRRCLAAWKLYSFTKKAKL